MKKAATHLIARALEQFAADELDVVEYAADLRAERDAYKLVASVALTYLHDGAAEIQRLRTTVRRQQEVIRDHVIPSNGRRSQ